MKLPVISGKEAIRAFQKTGWSIKRRAKIEAKVGRILAEWEGKASPSDLQSEY